ncbi:hypothetical protein PSN45_004786 [Yamadazyma tenuis]|uniref:uncharacterized protein n=1 Tax=Candida tenuis TaxID=2315449 RepID=UPI0027A4B2F6|nr:hypothetical protein PSN45_004786 [Yamadazyma tenuis]
MIGNKENVDPDGLTSILKHPHPDLQLEAEFTDPSIASIDDGDTATRFRRRVSFAPEVTLHKIDFIPQPQNRRRTIGTVEEHESSISSVSSSASVSSDSRPPSQVPQPIQDSSDLEDEVEMELTETIRNIREDTMEFTQSLARLNVPAADEIHDSMEETMEFTQSMPVIRATSSGSQDSASGVYDEPTMEFTQPISHIANVGDLSTINEQDEVESVNSRVDEPEMEVTQSVSKITKEVNSVAVDDIPEEEMEVTQAISKITQQEPNDEMDVTQAISKITQQEPNDKMDVTQAISKITQQEPTEDMEMTQPVSSIHSANPRSSLTDELSPQFPDVQIPIPSDLNNKRLSEWDQEPVIKVRKVSESVPVDIASSEVPRIVDNLRNYKNVSLSQFLNDLGIRFFDDIESDDVSNDLLTNSLTEEEYALEDYMKANNKLLVYSLYEFSNKDLSKNLVEGRTLYEELNSTISENNPDLFKEFYSSSLSEQESLKADLSLIQEYAKFEAKNTWYKWRIQLVENLLIKLQTKHEVLLSDKEKLENNLRLIAEEFDSKVEILKDLKTKLSVIHKAKESFKSDSGEFDRLKTQLSESKDDILKIQAEMMVKSSELLALIEKNNGYDNTVKTLTEEIKKHQALIDQSRKFSEHDIRLLNFNFKLFQAMSGIEYKCKEEGKMIFSYKEFKLSLGGGIKVETTVPTLYNSWIYDYIYRSIDSINGSTMEKFHKIKIIIDRFHKLDKEIFKISIKFPIKVIEKDNSNDFGFSVRFSKKNEFKAIVHFKVPLTSLVEEDTVHFKLEYELIKSYDDKKIDSILSSLKHQCHISNEILDNAVL